MDAKDFTDRGYALYAKIATGADGSTKASLFANTPVAIALIFSGTVLGVGAMLIQGHRRPQDPQLALAEGDGERSES